MARQVQGGASYPVVITGTELNGATSNALIARFYPYTTVRTGELIASSATGTGSKQCPNITCDLVKFIAPVTNTGAVYLGWNAGVTATDGVADTTSGLYLFGGMDSGWIPISNMNLLYYIAATAGDRLTYMAIAP